MGFSLITHETERVKGTNVRRVTKIKPYIRLNAEKGPPIFIQEGTLYSEGGQVVKEVPEWFDAELSKCSKTMLKMVKFDGIKKLGRPKGSKTKKNKDQEVTNGDNHSSQSMDS